MLVLSRKISERIIIGDDIVITIVDVRGDKVRLGIDAPPDVSVHRHEIYERIRHDRLQREAQADQTHPHGGGSAARGA